MIDFGADKNMTNLVRAPTAPCYCIACSDADRSARLVCTSALQKGKTAAQLTTYDKVRDVLTGHVAGSHSPHPPTQSAFVPRFARGTGKATDRPSLVRSDLAL